MSDKAKDVNESAKCRLLFMLVLTTFFFFVELIVGYVTNSMALVADSFHMLSDVIALVIAYISVRISPKKWSKNTFGWARAEVLGALVNAVFLAALCFSIFVESIKRFYKPEGIHDPILILVVGGLGLLVNVIGLFMFQGSGGHGHSHGGGGGGGGHGHSHGKPKSVESGKEKSPLPLPTSDPQTRPHSAAGSSESTDASRDPTPEPIMGGKTSPDPSEKGKSRPQSAAQMNMRGVFLHVLADALGSVIVMISATIILLTDWEYNDYIDPTLSVIMVCLILRTTWPLLVESAMILLQTVPTHIQVDSLQRKLLQEIDGVLAVHEFHVWQLAGDRIIASAHIRCRNLQDYMNIAEKVKEFFHNEGIHSTTIQPEFVDVINSDQFKNCALECPPQEDQSCLKSTCCGPQKSNKSTSRDALLYPNGVIVMNEQHAETTGVSPNMLSPNDSVNNSTTANNNRNQQQHSPSTRSAPPTT